MQRALSETDCAQGKGYESDMTGTHNENRKYGHKAAPGRVEILAPAGSYESFRAAVSAGADAVYAGGPRFGARAYADNFTEEELIRAIQEAHLSGRKLYLTVNTLLKEKEILGLYDYLLPLYEAGLDAVIVQDVGVVEYVRTHFPGLDIHASTQMTITGAYGAAFLEEQGVTRIVPARELSLAEIRDIREKTGLEIECFVHGALCYCYSGQCLLSSMIGGRSGNRGQCAQPCRLPYSMDGQKGYYLSPKDICTLEIIPDLVEAGIDSFKIEGRMKKPEYVAAVTSMYRKYTELYQKEGRKGYHVRPQDREMLMDLYNRGGFSQGYYKKHNGQEMMALERPNHAGVPALKVHSQKGRELRGRAVTDLNPGDVLEITGGKGNHTLGEAVAEGKDISFLVQKGVRIAPGTVLNRVRNESLIRSMQEDYIGKTVQTGIRGTLTLTVDAPAYLTVDLQKKNGETVTFTAETKECVRRAENRPMDEARVREQIQKTGNSEFFLEKMDIYMEDHIFLPIRQLNLLRRAALEGLKQKVASSYARSARLPGDGTAGQGVDEADSRPEKSVEGDKKVREQVREEWHPRFSILVETAGQLQAVLDHVRQGMSEIWRIYVEMSLLQSSILECGIAGGDRADSVRQMINELSQSGCGVFAAMPYIFREEGCEYEREIRRFFGELPFSGALIRNMEEYSFLTALGFDKKIILDHNLYVFNRYGKAFWKRLGISDVTAPLELNAQELAELGIAEAELMVYGYFPVMVSAQCLKKTAGKCGGRTEVTMLTDRLGNRFPVKTVCRECFNVIYNTSPLYLGTHQEEIRRLKPSALRVQFSVETEEETADMLLRLMRAFSGEEEKAVPEFSYTQGHFKRGVL